MNMAQSVTEHDTATKYNTTKTQTFPLKYENPVIRILQSDVDLYTKKAGDYSPEHFLTNFITSATFAATVGGHTISHIDSILVLIGTKLSRLQTLTIKNTAQNEAITDTLQDLRIYLAILEAALKA